MSEKEAFSLQMFLPYLLNQAAEESSLAFQQAYKGRYGMLRTEWRVLFHLGNYGEMTATDIVTRARIHKTKVSRAVQKLADRRFVKRERNDSDRRQEVLTLTSAGETAYRELRTIAEDYDRTLEVGFTEEEMHLLRSMLKRLAGFE